MRNLKRQKALSQLLIFLVASDLFAANAWMSATVPTKERTVSLNPVFSSIPSPSAVPVRIYRFPVWYPPEFEAVSSKHRLAEAVRWDKMSLFPKYTLPYRISVIDVRGTLIPKDYYAVAGKLRSELKDGESGTFEEHLARLGVQYAVTPNDVQLDADRCLTLSNDISLWKIHRPLERNYVLFEPNRLVLDVSLQQPETVVIPEQFWHGWRAFLEDGQEIPVKRVEDVFRGVDLPAGKHRLTMVYDPPLFKLGAVLSLFGIVLSLAFCRSTAK